jgi:hypothetical protein
MPYETLQYAISRSLRATTPWRSQLCDAALQAALQQDRAGSQSTCLASDVLSAAKGLDY